jgi:hypothetical protein
MTRSAKAGTRQTAAARQKQVLDKSARSYDKQIAFFEKTWFGGTAVMIRLERLLAPPERHRPQTAWLAAVAGLMPPAAVTCIPLAIAACDLIAYRA